MACACTSQPVWLGTTELTNLQVNLTPGPGLRLFWADCFGKACFGADLCFKEIHVDARAGYVMAARGAVSSHQPSKSGKTIYIYCDYCITCKHAGSVMVKAAGCYAHDHGFVPSSLQYFFFLYFLFMVKWNCACHVCTWYSKSVCMHTNIHTNTCIFVYIHGLNIVWMKNLHSLLYIRVCTWYIHGITWHRLGCAYDIHICTCLIVVHNKNMEKHSVLSVLPEVYNFILVCTAHVRCMYYAIVH